MPDNIFTSITPNNSSLFALIIRSYWALVGHAALIITAIVIFEKKLQSSLIVNGIYALLSIGLIVFRYIDIRFYNGETSDGEPATMSHWKKFSMIVLFYTISLWIITQIIARPNVF